MSQTTPHPDPSGASSVTVAELAAERARVFLLDVRSPEEFAAGHVPGSVNIPLDELERRRGEVPRDARVVCVCKAGGGRSGGAAAQLRQWGWPEVYKLAGGLAGWREAQGRPG